MNQRGCIAIKAVKINDSVDIKKAENKIRSCESSSR
jgi:hypothetical protein